MMYVYRCAKANKVKLYPIDVRIKCPRCGKENSGLRMMMDLIAIQFGFKTSLYEFMGLYFFNECKHMTKASLKIRSDVDPETEEVAALLKEEFIKEHKEKGYVVERNEKETEAV